MTCEPQTRQTPHQAPTHPAADFPLVVLPRGARPRVVAEWMPVIENHRLTQRHFSLVLRSPEIATTALPGQFLMITVALRGESTPTLPRPMAVYSVLPEEGTVEVLYAIVGAGTERLSRVQRGAELFVVGPLGRWFDLSHDARHVLLLGRGIGNCSLTTVAQHTARQGVQTTAVSSGRERSGLVGLDVYETGGSRVYGVADDDGSSAVGPLHDRLVTDLADGPPDHIFVCGSRRLVRLAERLARRWDSRVQISIEAHMACGLGYCHGCASGARSVGEESPLVCADGPVFEVAVPDRTSER